LRRAGRSCRKPSQKAALGDRIIREAGPPLGIGREDARDVIEVGAIGLAQISGSAVEIDLVESEGARQAVLAGERAE